MLGYDIQQIQQEDPPHFWENRRNSQKIWNRSNILP